MGLRLPPATLAIAGLTALVSLAIMFLRLDDWAMFTLGFIPARLGIVTPKEFSPVPALLTPLTATLVHGGYAHLFGNLAMLLITGSLAERVLGWQRTLIVYVAGAYAAASVQWMLAPHGFDPMIGASGAISACIGAQSALYGQLRASAIGPFAPRTVQIAWQIVAWTVINLLGDAVARMSGFPIAWGAHVGGFIAGILMARPLLFIRLRSGRVNGEA